MSNQGSPVFELELDGESLTGSTLKHLLSVEFKDALHQLDSVTIRLAVPEDADEVLQYCKPGVSFVVKLGYDGSSMREVHGDIIEVSHSRSTSSPWTVTLQGLDILHRLKKKRVSKQWEGSHSAVVESMASELGLTPEVEGTEGTGKFTMQFNQDFASILMKLAQENNYFVRVEEGKTLRFGRLSTEFQSNSVSLKWGEHIESVQLKYSVNDIVTKVTVKGHDYAADEWIEGKATSSDLMNISGGDSAVDVAEAAFGDVELHLDNAQENQQSDNDARAKAELQSRAEKFLSGSVSCIGVPDAAAGAKLTVEGAGWPLSGDFLIKEATHTFDPGSGYRTSISFYSDSLPPET